MRSAPDVAIPVRNWQSRLVLFMKYFSDLRDLAIGFQELRELEGQVGEKEQIFKEARAALKNARDKQNKYITFQKEMSSLHARLITSDDTFREHLYNKIRQMEAAKPFPNQYDPLSADPECTDSVRQVILTDNFIASTLFR